MSWGEKKQRPPSIIEQQITKELDDKTARPDEPPLSNNDNGYEAFKKSRDSRAERMLQINSKGNIRLLIYYYNIEEIEFKEDSLLTISTNRKIITIEGKNLSSVENHFRENRIISINEFDPLKYVDFPAANQPLIEIIRVEEVSREKESIF